MRYILKQKNDKNSYDLLIYNSEEKNYFLFENINLKNYKKLFKKAETRRLGGVGYLGAFASFLDLKNYKRLKI